MVDIKNILAEAQARADANGDGKLSIEDLSALKEEYGLDASFLDNLKTKIDANVDGKIDLADLQGGLGNIGGVIDDFKNQFFGK